MGLFDYLGDLAKEARSFTEEIDSIKQGLIDTATEHSSIISDVRDSATSIADSIKTEATEVIDGVKGALFSSGEEDASS